MLAKGFQHKRRNTARATSAVSGCPHVSEYLQVRANGCDGTLATVGHICHLRCSERFTLDHITNERKLWCFQVWCHSVQRPWYGEAAEVGSWLSKQPRADPTPKNYHVYFQAKTLKLGFGRPRNLPHTLAGVRQLFYFKGRSPVLIHQNGPQASCSTAKYGLKLQLYIHSRHATDFDIFQQKQNHCWSVSAIIYTVSFCISTTKPELNNNFFCC